MLIARRWATATGPPVPQQRRLTPGAAGRARCWAKASRGMDGSRARERRDTPVWWWLVAERVTSLWIGIALLGN